MAIYLQWVRRFRTYCAKRKLLETVHLTAVGVRRFTRAYVGPRLRGQQSAKNSCNVASNALHAWACALSALGTPLPPWREKYAPPLLPLLKEYCHYRRAHNGVSESTLVRDVEAARGFLGQLRREQKSIRRATLMDVDAFVRKLATRLSKRTVADTCSSLRAFLRFLPDHRKIAGRSCQRCDRTAISHGRAAPAHSTLERRAENPALDLLIASSRQT